MIQIVKTLVEGFHLNCMYGHNKNVSITVITVYGNIYNRSCNNDFC